MRRNIHLMGDLGARFGSVHSMQVNTIQEALKCLDCNFGNDFRQYLIECETNNIGFTFEDGEYLVGEEDLLFPIAKSDLFITPVVSGSKSAGAKIFTAIAIAAVLMSTAGSASTLGQFFWNAGVNGGAATLTTAGQITALVGVNLAMAGISQLMLPDPGTDGDQSTSYLFNGAEQNVISGDPVPVLYGRLRVPGQPISLEVVSRTTNPIGSDISVGEYTDGNATGSSTDYFGNTTEVSFKTTTPKGKGSGARGPAGG